MISEIWLFEDGETVLGASHEGRPDAVMRDAPGEPIGPLATAAGLAGLRQRVGRARGAGRSAWLYVDLVNATESEMRLLGSVFDLPELQVDDALNLRQRPKLERDGPRTFLVLRAVDYLEATRQVESHQVSAFSGPGYLITNSRSDYDLAEDILGRLRREPELIGLGTAAGLYAMLDVVVDGYLHAAAAIAEDISETEEAVFNPQLTSTTEQIYLLKRENLELKRAVTPLLGTAHSILRGHEPSIKETLQPYFRDVSDHLLRVADTTESNDQLLMTLLMAVTTLQDLRQNEDMRRISAYAAMGIVPTVIAGIYGMNFEFMPELDEWWGYPFALSLMAGVVFALHRAFRKSGWL